MSKMNKADRRAIYLVVADKSEEFSTALRYAARAAELNAAHVGILYIMEKHDFTHWGEIEQRMRQELRQEAEQILWMHARKVYELNGQIPGLYINHGNTIDALIETIDEYEEVKKLILAGNTGSSPGPLISYLSSKGLSRLRVPLTIVPGHLPPEDVDSVL